MLKSVITGSAKKSARIAQCLQHFSGAKALRQITQAKTMVLHPLSCRREALSLGKIWSARWEKATGFQKQEVAWLHTKYYIYIYILYNLFTATTTATTIPQTIQDSTVKGFQSKQNQRLSQSQPTLDFLKSPGQKSSNQHKNTSKHYQKSIKSHQVDHPKKVTALSPKPIQALLATPPKPFPPTHRPPSARVPSPRTAVAHRVEWASRPWRTRGVGASESPSINPGEEGKISKKKRYFSIFCRAPDTKKIEKYGRWKKLKKHPGSLIPPSFFPRWAFRTPRSSARWPWARQPSLPRWRPRLGPRCCFRKE